MVYLSKDPALFQRDWNSPDLATRVLALSSKDPALFQRDWNCSCNWLRTWINCRKTRPAPKGLKQPKIWILWVNVRSKDLALFQRDWNAPARSGEVWLKFVERPCPAPKGLKLLTLFGFMLTLYVERSRPASKGLKLSLRSGPSCWL